jgi:hypothetical protein
LIGALKPTEIISHNTGLSARVTTFSNPLRVFITLSLQLASFCPETVGQGIVSYAFSVAHCVLGVKEGIVASHLIVEVFALEIIVHQLVDVVTGQTGNTEGVIEECLPSTFSCETWHR